MSRTASGPAVDSLAQALRLAALFAAIKFLLHLVNNIVQAHLGYGLFRDELYYLVCGQHLTWGYVDHTPLVALQAKLSPALFGHSLAGVRMLTTAAGAGRVFLTGILAWALRGRRPAQALAMAGVLLSPSYFSIDCFLSMNSFESLFWMGCLLVVLLIQRTHHLTLTGDANKLWLAFGAIAGIGLMNKPSMVFFLAAVLLALALSPQRRLLFTRWLLPGIALTLLIVLPNLLWQFHHHWPTLEFTHGRHTTLIGARAYLRFLKNQAMDQQPLALILWGAGLLWLLLSRAARDCRWLGLTYLFFVALMLPFSPKNYYMAPIYPVLFAAGGIAWERHFHRSPRVAHNRILAFPVFTAALVLYTAAVLPLIVPILSPAATLRYQAKLTRQPQTDTLPQMFADRFGWQREAEEVTRIYNSLSPEEQRNTAILCSNYGEASAINILTRGLPTAISGDMNYFQWGPRGATGEVVILISGGTASQIHGYTSLDVAGHMDDPRALPLEQKDIYLARGRNHSLTEDWPRFKHY
jgi:hypothetical protein